MGKRARSGSDRCEYGDTQAPGGQGARWTDIFVQPANDPVRDDSRLRKKGPSEPSKDVIFLGLDPELTEKDVSSTMPSCEDLSLIRYTVYGLLEGSTPDPAVVSKGRHG
jgi:hypothetical protein